MMKSWVISKIAAVKFFVALICAVSLIAFGISGCSSSQPDEANTVSNISTGGDSETVNETQQAQTDIQVEETVPDPVPALEIEDEKLVEVDEDGDWPIVYLLANRGGGAFGGDGRTFSEYSQNSGYPTSPDGFEVYAFHTEDVKCAYDDVNGFSINISDTGSEDWHIQLKKNGVKVENGKWYQVTFDAKSSIDRSIVFAMQRDGSADEDWRTYSGAKTVLLGNEWKPYTIIFRMTDDTDENAIYNFALGTVGGNRISQQHTICIKNMRLEMLEDSWLNQVSQGDNLLKNPNFEYEDIGWEASVVEPGAAKVKFENGKAVFDISNAGTLDWHVQLKQNSISLEHGYNYRLTFKASSTASRSINIGFMDNEFVHWYGGSLEELNAGAERMVAVEFYMDQATNNDACMFISLGRIENTNTPASVITLSDFSLVKLPGRPQTSTARSSWSSWSSSGGDGGWTAPIVGLGSWQVSYWGGRVGQCSEVDSGSYLIEILDTGSLDWHVQMQKKGIVLENGKTYKMSFEARSSVDRKIGCVLQKDGSSDDVWTSYSGGSGQYQLNDGWQTFTNEFTMTSATDRNVIYSISLGAVDGRITTPHKVYIRNLKLEEVPEQVIVSVPVGEEMLTGEWAFNNPISGNSITENNGIITASIVDLGDNDYDVQIVKKGLMLEEGCTYEFRCNADFDNGQRVIKVGIMQDGTYDWYGGEDLTIGTAARARTSSGREYTFTFTVNKRTIRDGMLVISMGKIEGKQTPTGTVSLSNLSLKKISEETDKPDDSGLKLIADGDDNMLKGKELELSVNGGASAKLDGTKITINNVGTEDYHVQLKCSGLKLEKGAAYEFKADASFEAGKNETDKTRKIKVGFMSNDGKYDWYGGGTTADIKSESSPIKITLTMDKETDADTLFTISMGQMETEDGKPISTPTGIVTLSNISIVKTKDASKPDDSGLKLIADGDDNMLKGKEIELSVAKDKGASAELDGTQIAITNVGTEDWHVQLKCNSGLKLEKGATYEIKADASFEAGANEKDKTRKIKFALMGVKDTDKDPEYVWYGGTTADIKSESSPIKVTFTMEKETDANTQFAISMGQMKTEGDKPQNISTPTGTVTLSNISIVKTKDAPETGDPKPDVPEAPANLIASVDGNILDMLKIKSDNMNGATKNDALTQFEISDLGDESWNVSIEQKELPLVEGHKYRFSGNVYSSTARKIEVLIQSETNWDRYAEADPSFEAGETKKVVKEFTYSYSGTADNEVRFFVGMGKVGDSDEAGIIQLSNFSLVDLDATEEPDDPPAPIEGNLLPPLKADEGWNLNLNSDDSQGVVAGSATKEYTDDGTVVIHISDVGNEAHSVQFALELVDSIKLEEGAEYKVSCDVESDVARQVTMIVQKKGGDWAPYAGKYGEPISANIKTPLTFTFTKSDDLNAILAVNLGKIGDSTPTGTVTLSNISIVKTKDAPEPDDPKPDVPEAPANLLASVDGNILEWSKIKSDNMNNATKNDALTQFEISELGDKSWKVSIEQPNLPLVKGHTYIFKGKVYSSTDRTIEVYIELAEGDYHKYADNKLSFKAGEKKEIEGKFTYDYNGTSVDPVRFFVGMGKVDANDKPGIIQLGDFSLVDITDPEEPDDPPTPVEGNLLPPLEDDKGWYLGNGGDKVKLSYKDGTAVINISDVEGSQPWDIQFAHDIDLENGAEYEVSCDVKSDVTRTIAIGVQGKTSYESYGSLEDGMLIANETKNKTFTVKKNDDDDAMIYFNLGDSGDAQLGTITLSNISIVKTKDAPKPDDPEPDVPDAPANLLASGGGNILEQSKIRSDNMNNATKNDALTQFEISELGDDSWKVSIEQPNLPLVKGHTYIFKGTVYSSTDRTIEVCIQLAEGDYHKYAGDVLSFKAGEKKEIEGKFTYDYNGTSVDPVRFFVGMGKAGANDKPGIIQLSGFSLVDITDPDATELSLDAKIETSSLDSEVTEEFDEDVTEEEPKTEEAASEETEEEPKTEEATSEETEEEPKMEETTSGDSDEDSETEESTSQETPKNSGTPEADIPSYEEEESDVDDEN